jgi:hypothetical protein
VEAVPTRMIWCGSTFQSPMKKARKGKGKEWLFSSPLGLA